MNRISKLKIWNTPQNIVPTNFFQYLQNVRIFYSYFLFYFVFQNLRNLAKINNSEFYNNEVLMWSTLEMRRFFAGGSSGLGRPPGAGRTLGSAAAERFLDSLPSAERFVAWPGICDKTIHILFTNEIPIFTMSILLDI